MEEHRTKRPRITRGEDDYLPGNIIEIELHNFMTFNSLKCKPGSRLNLVIGPNGSGKSSLVCAIALGLGGEPQLLGRATSIGAYVKRGEESAHIQISLRGFTGDELIIKRKIDTRNRSEWVVNGKAVTRKEVLEIIQKFNIQVNNLTQFLPQDRVCEFAKLTPVQLLEETEKAVGDPQLPIQHQTLIRKSDELKRVELAVHRNKETLDQMKALNAEQEKDVERVRQREKLLKKAELMKMKLPWLKYDLIKAEFNEAKDEEKDAKKNLDAAAKNLNDLREPIEKQKQENRRLEAKLKNVITSINDNADMRRALAGEEKELREQIRLKYKRMEDMRRQEEDRQQRILKAKEDLAAAVSELRNLPLYEPPKEEIERLGSQIAEIEISAKQKRIQKSEKERLLVQNRESLKHCMDRLREMENKNNKLLRALQRSGADRIFEAHKWLQDHQHELKNAVYGPVLLEVNVTSRDHANYLDGHIPHYIWKSFITQDPSDRDFLVKHMRMFDVPVLNYTNEKHRKVPFDPSLEMRHLGIYSRLDQVFEAPDAVKEVLISQFNLEYSYIGYKEADENAAEVFSRLGISDFWTPENHYRWSKSRYGDHVSGSVQQVSMSRLLLSSSDAGEIENLHSKKAELEESVASLEESVRSYQIEMRHLEDEAAKLHKQREEIISVAQNEKKKRRDMEQRITQKRRRLESVEKEEDVDTVIAKLIDEVVKFNNQRFHCAIKVKKLFIETLSHQRSFAEKRLSSIESDAKIRELECNIKDQEKFALQASLHYEYCKKEMDECRERLLAAKRHAESVAVITRELGRAFLEMPTTIEDLEVAIQENIHEANSILFLNQNVLKEYEERQRQIESLASKLDTDDEELKRCLSEIEAIKVIGNMLLLAKTFSVPYNEIWLPKLRNLVAQINETFSRNFQEMAVAGEVSLDEHDFDFAKFGILIKVKFRQTSQLQVLSAYHQSGGERSVSTILYLVSLQDLTNCPFRVVDEINQGMDAINERKMFQQLVRAASQPNTPQCFLLTPKLLPDLEYSEACSILNIMNGPWIEQPSKAWRHGDPFGIVMGLVGESQC